MKRRVLTPTSKQTLLAQRVREATEAEVRDATFSHDVRAYQLWLQLPEHFWMLPASGCAGAIEAMPANFERLIERVCYNAYFPKSIEWHCAALLRLSKGSVYRITAPSGAARPPLEGAVLVAELWPSDDTNLPVHYLPLNMITD
jgi:hypothetical protein